MRPSKFLRQVTDRLTQAFIKLAVIFKQRSAHMLLHSCLSGSAIKPAFAQPILNLRHLLSVYGSSSFSFSHE